MGTLLGWLLVLGIGVPVSIALHEVGHLVPAKRFGVRCTQYMVGFGPTLWSTRRGDTEYGIKAIPLGGYVRMIGMFPPKRGAAGRSDRSGRLGTLIDQARADAQRDIGPDDGDKLFYQRSVPRRLVIMLGGPLMNLVIASVLLTGLVTLHGLDVSATTRVLSVVECVVPVSSAADSAKAVQRGCQPTDPKSPAAVAGLQPGDQIVSYDGVAVDSWSQVQERIRANTGTPVALGVRRAGALVTLTATPVVSTRYLLDANDQPVKAADGSYKTVPAGFLGVEPAAAFVKQPVTAVPGIIGSALVQTAGIVLQIPQKVYGVGQAVFGGSERDPNGPISLVGVGRIAGDLGSAQGSAAFPVTFADRLVGWLSLIASLNLALFVFNLIPLLPLDGGHVAGALWEAARRRVAKLRHRPDPGPVDIAKALPVAYAVVSVLVGLSVFLIYADLVKPVRVGG